VHILDVEKKKEVINMKCSLGILCEPLQSLGLHSHRSVATKRSSKRVTRKPATKRRKRR